MLTFLHAGLLLGNAAVETTVGCAADKTALSTNHQS